MTDKNKDERTISQILSDEMDRQMEENPPAIPTLEEFRKMAHERLEEEKAKKTESKSTAEPKPEVPAKEKLKRLKRFVTIAVAAAVIILVLTAIAGRADVISDVDADKNPKETIVTEDGVIIEDGGWGSSVSEDNVWETQSWGDVQDAKMLYPKLIVPQYMPTGYTFKKLSVESTENGTITCEYFFSNADDIIEIEQYAPCSKLNSYNMGEYSRTATCEKGCIYIYDNEQKAIIQKDDGIISLWCKLRDEEIIKIIENLTI